MNTMGKSNKSPKSFRKINKSLQNNNGKPGLNTTSYEERQKQISAAGKFKNDFESKIATAQQIKETEDFIKQEAIAMSASLLSKDKANSREMEEDEEESF